jgi:NCS1 family nucleobase:cation symporter-1
MSTIDVPSPPESPRSRTDANGRIRGIETRTVDYVPLAERHGRPWHLWPIWFSGGAGLLTASIGTIGTGLGLNLFWSLVAILAGTAFGTLFMAAHSSQGPHMGLPQMIQSRPQFGYLGALLVWIVALLTYLIYTIETQELAGDTVRELAGGGTTLPIVAFTAIAVGLAIYGYDIIHVALRGIAFVMAALLLVVTIALLAHGGFPDGALDASPSQLHVTPFLVQFFAGAAYQLSWAIYVSDYSRYLPATVSTKATMWWTYVGSWIGGAWIMVIAAIAVALTGVESVVGALRAAGDFVFSGFGTVTMILLLVSTLAIVGANFYGMTLTLFSAADSIRPVRSTARQRTILLLVLGVALTVVALTLPESTVGDFGSYLAILVYLFTPWTAINLVDYFLVRRQQYSIREIFNPDGMYGRWNLRGLSAYFVGFAVMVPFMSTKYFTGPVAKALDGADLSMLVGLPVAAGVYLWACRSMDLVDERRRARIADEGLEAAPHQVSTPAR